MNQRAARRLKRLAREIANRHQAPGGERPLYLELKKHYRNGRLRDPDLRPEETHASKPEADTL